jgi:hypothetical protein
MSGRRSFRPLRSLALPKRTCFVLTEAGTALAKEARKSRTGPRRTHKERASRNGKSPIRPSWDGESVLSWDGEVLKEFRRAATMQKRILEEFEKQGWPHRIDNPLPRLTGVNRKQHLRDTIKNLNRGLTRRMILFFADGAGQGICWMPVLGG